MSSISRPIERSYAQEWAVYCGLFLSTLDTGIVSVALKPISLALDAPLAVVGLTVSFYLFALIAALIPSGWLGDRYGCERVLSAGFIVFGLASLLCSYASTIEQLIAFRAIQGLGAAMVQGNALGFIAKRPSGERLRMSTYVTAAISVGPILGPSLGGLLLDLGSWPTLFLVNLPFCVFGAVVSWQGRLPFQESTVKRINWLELFLFAATIILTGLFLYSLDTGMDWPQLALMALSAGAVALTFLSYEWRTETAFFPLSELTARAPAFIAFGAFVLGATAGAFFATAPVLLLGSLNESISFIGLLTSAAPVGLCVGAIARKRFSSSLSGLRAMQTGTILMLAALLAFSSSAVFSNSMVFAVTAAIYGIGGGLFQVSNINCAGIMTPHRPSTAGSMLRLFQNLGIALGAAAALFLLQHETENLMLLPSSIVVWWIVAAAALALFVFSLFQRMEDYEAH